MPDVGRFNERLAPLYERLDAGARNAASRSIPTLILMLTFPDRDIYVRSDLFQRARQALAKKAAFEDEGPLTTDGYRDLRAFAEALRDAIDELAPADMIDVQGFLWAIFSHSDLWFGGVSHRDEAGRNLWIVGTMNTAGRSIALMDVALRRRFVFREVGVDYGALASDFAACAVAALVVLDLAAFCGA